VLGEPGPQVIGPGQDQGPGLVDRLGAFSHGAALGDHQRADRLDRAVPALRRAAGPAGLGGPGRADGIQQVGLALPPTVLAVGTIHLHDPDACSSDVPGQARAVAAGPFDADQADGPEPAQPAQQAGISSRGGGKLLDAEQPADRVERRRDVHVSVGVDSAGDGACLYDGYSRPFLWLRDGTHPLAVGPVNPGLLPRPGRSDRQRRWVPENLGPGRQIVSQDSPSGVSRIGGRAGTQAPDPTPVLSQDRGSWPEALSTVSLPNISADPLGATAQHLYADVPILYGSPHRVGALIAA